MLNKVPSSAVPVEGLEIELSRVINSTGFTEVVVVSAKVGGPGPGVLEVLFRCSDHARLAKVFKSVLSAERGWLTFVGKRFLLVQDELLYGWFLSVTSDDLAPAVREVARVIELASMSTTPTHTAVPTPPTPPGVVDDASKPTPLPKYRGRATVRSMTKDGGLDDR